MKIIKYFIQFLIIVLLFGIFKIIGAPRSSNFCGLIVSKIGPIFRSKKIIDFNLSIAFPELSIKQKEQIKKKMWFNYGRMLGEYIFLKNFRYSSLSQNVEIEGKEILENIKKDSTPVIFISGHFNNFELMAMQIEKIGINLAAIYRPLNNIFLNPIMENIREKYICKNQIKKGISGTKQSLKFFKNGTSIALMIDQRVSQGIKSKFFRKDCFTTSIPAQFVKKFQCKIVPIYIERTEKINFRMKIYEPVKFSNLDSTEFITSELNKILEKMIKLNPDQWIWTHNRWKE